MVRIVTIANVEGVELVPMSDYAALLQSHARLLREMARYRPVLERAFERPQDWTSLTAGTGIATPNGYVAAIAAAQPFAEK